MRNMMKKAAQNVKAVAVRAGMLMKDTKGENYVDTAVKILIAVVRLFYTSPSPRDPTKTPMPPSA